MSDAPKPHKRLFIPGPVEVAPEILAAMATPMIGHRSDSFRALYREVIEGLRWVLGARASRVLTATSSATGVWEGTARNCVKKRTLHLVNGAFSERWEEVTRLNARETGVYAVDWGKAHRADVVRRELETGKYDSIAIVHSETSTGVLNPLAEICEAARRFDDVLIFVDAVSSLTTVPIDFEGLGVDVLLAGVQKGFALPPGLTVFTVSERALARSKTISDRGYYFNFEVMAKSAEKDETPSTPAISLLFALRTQIERMRREGLAARFERHRALAGRARSWAKERGFALFAEPGYETMGLTCVANTRGIDLDALAKHCGARGFSIDKGYGKAKGKTFRIAHMGDVTMAELDALLAAMDELVAR
jgi:predicted phosphoserine aminotransferase